MKLLDVTEVASLLVVSEKTIYYYVGRNEIPFIRVGKHLRFEQDQVLAHFKAKTIASVQHPTPLVLVKPPRSLKTGGSLALKGKE